jgi:hypothetical protein
MATCPHCKGHLTDTHRCPRRPAVVVAEIVFAAVLGGFSGLLLVAIFDPRGQVANLDTIAIVVGAIAGVGLDRALRG